MQEIARVLLQDYNEYRSKTGHFFQVRSSGGFSSSLKSTPERLTIFSDMADWCRKRSIDPRLWIYALFCHRKFRFSPPLDQLKSEKVVSLYKQFVPGDDYREKILREVHADQVERGARHDPLRDLTAATEGIKKRYQRLNDWDRCFQNMETETFGFHPKSLVCAACPISRKCRDALCSKVKFDVMAYRRGELTVGQVRQQELGAFYAARR